MYRDEYNRVQSDVFWTFPRALFAIVGMLAVLSVVGFIFGIFGEAAKVTQEQFGPAALLQKYEWFKDAAAELDKKQADIGVYDNRFKRLETDYVGVPRTKWARDDREQLSIWQSEAAGVKASYNQLAAEYNAQMSKFNYRFTNVGDLPRGADKPLPREFKPYIGE